MVHQASCPLTLGCTAPQRPGLGCCNCSSSGDPRADALKPQVGFLGAVPRLLPLASPCATPCTSLWSLRWLETSSLSGGLQKQITLRNNFKSIFLPNFYWNITRTEKHTNLMYTTWWILTKWTSTSIFECWIHLYINPEGITNNRHLFLRKTLGKRISPPPSPVPWNI